MSSWSFSVLVLERPVVDPRGVGTPRSGVPTIAISRHITQSEAAGYVVGWMALLGQFSSTVKDWPRLFK
jgi:hypothetical protein